MVHDARFGLTISLVDALRADSSPDAAELVQLLAEDKDARPVEPAPRNHWRTSLETLTRSLGASPPRLAAFAGLQIG